MYGDATEHSAKDALRLVSSNNIRTNMGQESTTAKFIVHQIYSDQKIRSQRQTDEYSTMELECHTTIEDTRNRQGNFLVKKISRRRKQ